MIYLEKKNSVKWGKTSDNGGAYMTIITCDMFISKDTSEAGPNLTFNLM